MQTPQALNPLHGFLEGTASKCENNDDTRASSTAGHWKSNTEKWMTVQQKHHGEHQTNMVAVGKTSNSSLPKTPSCMIWMMGSSSPSKFTDNTKLGESWSAGG